MSWEQQRQGNPFANHKRKGHKRHSMVVDITINSQVAIGLRIITDGWQAYKTLGDEGYEWDWVNHSKNFVKPGTKDIHTNSIEG